MRIGVIGRAVAASVRLAMILGLAGSVVSTSFAQVPAEDRSGESAGEMASASDEPAAGSDAGVVEDELDPLYSDLYSDVGSEEDGGDFDVGPVGYPDPMEGTNRGVLAFNGQVDKWLLDPLTEAYQFVVPKQARHAISRVFLNLSSTKVIVNDLVQLEWVDAGVTTSRLLINSTVGLVGLFDVADRLGLERHDSDFGQTLALAGTPSGPYVVLPILGPATIRDGVGTVIDGFFQPTYYILGPAELLIGPTEILLYSGSSGLSTRERHFAELKALQDSSIDFYAALRSGYYQDRIVEIWGRREGHITSAEPVYGSSEVSGKDD
jgi:phospholipid-binding lipoprotein MlaA